MLDSSTRDHQRRLVRFLGDPRRYPHTTEKIVHRETHVSHVFLAGAFAYKIKKAVTFPFLDASTLALRKRWCTLEIRLNRRLAPETYLDVVPITEEPDGLRLGGRGRVVEWAVKMRRLPEERMLDRLVARRQVSLQDADRIMDRLLPFFRHAPRSRVISRVASPARLRQLLLGNLHECRPWVGRLILKEDVDAIDQAYQAFLGVAEPLLQRRVQRGFIIDGHGDLRCENICLTDPVVIFDCIEFNPGFRCGDVVNDLAFLLMDLEFRGRGELAQAMLARYRREARDPSVEALLPLYKCHRSLVRGKVRALAWQQHPRTPFGKQLQALARQHFQLARRYASQLMPPRLIVICGLIGTGKSTLARRLAATLNAHWLRTDEIRRREFGALRRPIGEEEFHQGRYAPSVSAQVYQRLHDQAAAALRQRRSVICDGMFSRADGRQVFRDLARHHGARFHLFECVTTRHRAKQRVAQRLAARHDLSEAKPEFYERLRAEFEPVRGFSLAEWTRVSTDGPPRQTATAALAALQRAWWPDA